MLVVVVVGVVAVVQSVGMRFTWSEAIQPLIGDALCPFHYYSYSYCYYHYYYQHPWRQAGSKLRAMMH